MQDVLNTRCNTVVVMLYYCHKTGYHPDLIQWQSGNFMDPFNTRVGKRSKVGMAIAKDSWKIDRHEMLAVVRRQGILRLRFHDTGT